LDLGEELLEEARHNPPVGAVGAVVEHGSEGPPHGVCLPCATLIRIQAHTYKHQQVEQKSKETKEP
jgi:hypothetical protein